MTDRPKCWVSPETGFSKNPVSGGPPSKAGGRQIPRKGSKGIRPNAGLQAIYRRRLVALVGAMNASVKPEIARLAADNAMPAPVLRRAIRKLAKRWQRNFDEVSPKLAEWFAKASHERSDAQLRKILRDGGHAAPKFQMTRAMRDAMQTTIGEQVGLIRSIPQQYLTQVETLVMQSVKAGRDIGQLTKAIEKQYGVTKRRAAFIATDQNSKATSAMGRARQLELNLDEGIWMHSHAGKIPRPTHVANSGKRFSLRTGWYDPHEKKWIMPGWLPRCRCFWKPVI